ncbi:MAG TPA: hypothetical protein VM925_24920, partial [Labilithrix sp.]|nr:hypothetical protein [Labilithrix sp.]
MDDIILGDDEPIDLPPPVVTKPSSPPPPLQRPKPAERPSAPLPAPSAPPRRNSNRIKAVAAPDSTPPGRKRAKMTLRIPDDEVSRPTLPALTPDGGVAAVGPSRPPSSPEPVARSAGTENVLPPRARPLTGPP